MKNIISLVLAILMSMTPNIYGISAEYSDGYTNGEIISQIKTTGGNWVLGGFFMGALFSIPGVLGSMYLSTGYHKPPKEYYYFEENNEYRLGFEDGYSVTSAITQTNQAVGASIFGAIITPLIIYSIISANKKY